MLSGSTGSQDALEKLCRIYWPPLYAFIRRKGFSKEDSEDLTQAFLAFLLEREAFKHISPAKGSFRNFLSASLNHFLSNEWDKRKTQKRGGKCALISLDEFANEERAFEDCSEYSNPDILFDIRCAVVLVNEAINRLGDEQDAVGRAPVFDKLQPYLAAPVPKGVSRQLAADLGINLNALKSVLHRLRRDFGNALHEEVRQTLDHPTQQLVNEEVQHLLTVLSYRKGFE